MHWRCQVWNLIPPDESLKAVMRLEVYVNGVLAASAAGYVGSYFDLPMSKAGRDAIKSGQNVISVHCHQTDGAQVIDVGIGTPS
jgi:hypothetical protein